MNCKQAEIAMMENMEKTIQPARARDLAQHVLECETCREYYIGFDMALEVLDDETLAIPPLDFTQKVMAQVNAMPAHSKPIPMSLRILWGLGAIFLGVGLMFAFNPAWLTAMTEAYPVLYNIINAMETVRIFAAESLAELTGSYQGIGLPMISAALGFVVIVGMLLMVLQRSEKSTKA